VSIRLDFEITLDAELLKDTKTAVFWGNFEEELEKVLFKHIREFFAGYTADELYFSVEEKISSNLRSTLKESLLSRGLLLKQASLVWAFTPPSMKWIADNVSNGGRRVILLGIDGLEWKLLNEWLADLPNFRLLISSGISGDLKSQKPLYSPAIWTDIATGTKREKHGIPFFVKEDPITGKSVPYTSNMRKTKAFWNIGSDLHLTVGVLGWLISWPAETVNGFVVSSYIPYIFQWGAKPKKGTFVHDLPDQTYPPEMYDEIKDFKINPQDISSDTRHSFFNAEQFERFDEITEEYIHGLIWSFAADETYREMGKYLIKQYSPDIFGIYFGGIDVTSHRFWRYYEPEKMPVPVTPEEVEIFGKTIHSYYRHIDDILGDFLEFADDSTYFMVISDHGFQADWRPKKYPISGWHRDVGVYILKGPGVKEHVSINGAESVDITPTILYALDCPISMEMDGVPLVESFSKDWRDHHPLRRITTYEVVTDSLSSQEETPITSPLDKEITSRLKAIGYID
jgi:predicted AlkP superfamily phosphohydrolase/phosphomutase